ncbi:co-chaperone GroES [Desulfofundulus sp.]|uniref:co-chaperone GroES n=1 Tax=Desulfofundulus sp. TaxID=2282750 RepID=UPI003C75E9F9
MKIRPLGERVVVKPLPTEEKTKGGIVLPETAKEKPQEGEVVAVGPGRLLENGTRVPVDLKVGDRVLFSKYAGNEVKIDDEEFLIMREADILGVIEK